MTSSREVLSRSYSSCFPSSTQFLPMPLSDQCFATSGVVHQDPGCSELTGQCPLSCLSSLYLWACIPDAHYGWDKMKMDHHDPTCALYCSFILPIVSKALMASVSISATRRDASPDAWMSGNATLLTHPSTAVVLRAVGRASALGVDCAKR